MPAWRINVAFTKCSPAAGAVATLPVRREAEQVRLLWRHVELGERNPLLDPWLDGDRESMNCWPIEATAGSETE